MGLDGPGNIRPFEEKTGAVFWVFYGQTETSGRPRGLGDRRPGHQVRRGDQCRLRAASRVDREKVKAAHDG